MIRKRDIVAIGVAIAGIAWGPAAGLAQGGDWTAVLAAAKKEGHVTFYSAAPPETTARIADGFKTAHPDISIEVFRGLTGDLLPRIEQERLSGSAGADVLLSTDVGFMLNQAKAGRLLKPDGPAMAGWPARYLRDGVVPSVGFEPIVMDYNTKLVNDPPRTYADILKPEFKGKVGIENLAATTVIAWYDWVERTQIPDYLVRLKAQNPKIYPGQPALPQAVAAGEVEMANFGTFAIVNALIAQGAPLALAVPPQMMGFQYVVGGFGWSRNPNAARILVDYILSREGQSVWHGKGESASPLKGIAGALDADSITPYDPDKYPKDFVTRYTARWTAILK